MAVIEKTDPIDQTASSLLSNASQVFPWLMHLSSRDIESFYADFFQAIEQSLHHKNWLVLEETISSWQATAEVLANNELMATLMAPSSDDDWEEWTNVESELFNTDS